MFVAVDEENGNEWQMRMQIQRDARQVVASKYDVRYQNYATTCFVHFSLGLSASFRCSLILQMLSLIANRHRCGASISPKFILLMGVEIDIFIN